jgi:hypothetical protein
MKTKIALFFASILLVSGCDKIKDLADVSFSTDLSMSIPVVVAPAKSASILLDVSGVSFSATQDLSLGDNEDVEPYLSKIKSIDLKSLVVTVTGLSEGQTINTISLAVTGVGTICTQTGITSVNNSFTPVINETMLSEAEAKFKSDKKITVTVSGEASGPMTFTVGLVFDADIKAGALD